MTGTEAPGHLPVLRATGWALCYLALGFGLMLAFVALWAAIAPGLRTPAGPNESGMARGLVVQTVCGLLGFGASTLLVGRRVLHLSWADLRWVPLKQAPSGFGIGLALGAAAAVVAVVMSLVAADGAFHPDSGTLPDYLRQLGLTALILAPAALLEEVMFRGVAQVVLSRAIGRIGAILALSGVFALAHLFNPNTSPLGLLNIGLAGVFLAMTFYLPGGIWTAWGAHLGWNGALAALDAPVSGLPFRIPLIDYSPGGPSWLTGGSFGPEGGLLATMAILAATAVAWRRTGKERA